MEQQVDGLAILQDRRERQSNRGAPPPRHPRGASVSTSDDVTDAEPSSALGSVVDLTSVQPKPQVQVQPEPGDEPKSGDEVSEPAIVARSEITTRRSGARKPKSESPPALATTGLRAAQFYIDDRCDDYLRDIRVQALVRKLDVSGSAVVRLALHRLMEQLSSTQVADRLATPVGERAGSGRKRH